CPGIKPSAGEKLLAGGGFELPANKSRTIQLPLLWSGVFWSRHGCTFDKYGRGRCTTGDCGGYLSCNGSGGSPPATLAEFTLGLLDFYDVSLVDGYNVLTICNVLVINRAVEEAKQAKHWLAARYIKYVFRPLFHKSLFSSAHCCTRLFGNPISCKQTAYSKIFKTACPTAHSYAYDDPISIFTCSKANYIVTFCSHHRR
ncbi:hypothetical protein CARUB_v10022250mg, partial [Capsella rubella]